MKSFVCICMGFRSMMRNSEQSIARIFIFELHTSHLEVSSEEMTN